MTPNRKHWQMDTSWEELDTIEMPGGALVTRYSVGVPENETAPTVFRATYPPHSVVAPHKHESDYTEIILEGSQQITRRWHHAGDIRIVQGGTVYGPLIAGPEGVTVLVFFTDNRWQAIPVDPENAEGLDTTGILDARG